MKRRNFLAGAATAAVRPLRSPSPPLAPRPEDVDPRAAGEPYQPRSGLDHRAWSRATTPRMVFETLYGRDEKLDPKPQMVEGHQVEDNGLRWTMRLRDGLAFHDGEKVLARDCVASLQRWMKRDAIGQTIATRMDALEAPDDQTPLFSG